MSPDPITVTDRKRGMPMKSSFCVTTTALVVLTACSTAPPTAKQLADDAAVAMGGADRLQSVRTISMRGGVGSRFRHGQTVRVTDMESPGTLKNVVETADLPGGRAMLD